MYFAHRLALSTLLDRLGDLIELIHWSGLAKFMNVSVPLTEIKALLYSNYSMIFGEHMWDKATELVQKSHQSVFLLAKQEPYYPQRRGFRSLAKLIVEIEGQLNTCIDVLKVIAIAAVQDLGEADKRANGLAYALSNEEGPPPINSVTTYDPTIQSLATVQKIRQDARKLSVYICRSLSDVLDAAARLDDPDGCPRGVEDHKSMEEDEDRSQLAKRWFPKEYREGEPAYINKPFGALECRIVEMTHRLERSARHKPIPIPAGGHTTDQVEAVPAERSDPSQDEVCELHDI
ncbi:unnamed protein product [Clonostachys chloroleuca]|uniref:Uncharacterized protein n=1 Tax=Clonostachys chloroleuca TaxID=1926264 RepID=A0AA35Q1U1_9HYPO|nr:unnamed protein product [Clonostachys chloroleuca]